MDLFQSLPIKVLTQMVNSMKTRLYLPNEFICKLGGDGKTIYFIYIGTVAVYNDKGKEV